MTAIHRIRSIPSGLMILTLALALCTGASAQTTWYVADGATGMGTQGSPLGSIQGAIAAAANGDRVQVGPGTYFENLNFLGKEIVVESESGPAVTTIDGGATYTTVKFSPGSTDEATLAGFTVTNGKGGPWRGGAFDIDGSYPTIRHCRIVGNTCLHTGGHGAAFFVKASGQPVTVFNCLIHDNHGHGQGIITYATGGSQVRLFSCTIAGNSAGSIYSQGELIRAFATADSVSLMNTAFVDNPVGSGIPFSGAVTADYCYLPFSHSGGTGNVLFINPGMVDELGSTGPADFHLESTSPLIDAGTLDYPFSAPNIDWVDLEGEKRFQGRCDIGVYETEYTPKVIDVPADYPSIQAAVDAAWHGDEVVVAAGPYPGFNWPNNKQLVVRSAGGAAATFMEFSGAPNSLVQIAHYPNGPALGREARLEGFTIRFHGTYPGALEAAGLHIESCSPTIERCIFTYCIAQADTGAISILASDEDADPLIRNCEFHKNDSAMSSTVQTLIRVFTFPAFGTVASAQFQGCTFANNHLTGGSAGLVRSESGPVSFENCIFWGNTPTSFHDPAGQLSITSSCVQGGFAGAGNINTDPMLVDAVNGDLHLQAGSPCIDAGDPSSATIGAIDIDGDPRMLHLSIDMGSDEVQQSGLFNILVGPGGYSAIQDAIDAAFSGDTISVAPGTYRESIRFYGKSLTLMGSGTTGANTTTISADYDDDGEGDFPAVFFIDGEGPGTVIKNLRIEKGMNRQIAYESGIPTLTYTGFVINKILRILNTKKPPTPHGGGIICLNSSPTIENCLIEDCGTESTTAILSIGASTGSGAGIAVVARGGGTAAPIIQDCIIRNNATGNGWALLFDVDSGSGGGVYCAAEDASSSATVTLQNCQIEGNDCGFSDDTPGDGGGVCVRGYPGAANARLVMTDCQVTDNSAGWFNGTAGLAGWGGGLYFIDAAPDCVIDDTQIIGNLGGVSTRAGIQANFTFADPPHALDTHSGQGGHGGGIAFDCGAATTSSLTLRRCNIAWNEAGSSYACFLASSAGQTQLQTGGSGGGIYVNSHQGQTIALHLDNCMITSNLSGSGVGTSPLDLAGNGGGIVAGAGFLTAMQIDVDSCTIADNAVGTPAAYYVGGHGAGMHLSSLLGGNLQVDFANSILWFNGQDGVFVNQDGYSSYGPTMDHCNVEGGWTGVGSGNMAADPMFVQRGFDYHLAAGSPCIDTGAVAGSMTDIDGDLRFFGAQADIGADESMATGSSAGNPWPGSQEDLLLLTTINGVGVPTAPQKSALPGDTIAVSLITPGGTFVGDYWILGGLFYYQGSTPPPQNPNYPDIHVMNGGFIMAESLSWLGNVLMSAEGIHFNPVTVPTYLAGQNILMQGFVLSGQAANGLYAATNATEIQFD